MKNYIFSVKNIKNTVKCSYEKESEFSVFSWSLQQLKSPTWYCFLLYGKARETLANLKIIQVSEPADQGFPSPNGYLWKSCLKLLLKAPSQASPGKIGFYII